MKLNEICAAEKHKTWSLSRTELKKDMDLCNFKIDTLNKMIDAVAADLKAHRTDTEAHHGVYMVKES